MARRDSGRLQVCRKENTAPAGDKPRYKLVPFGSYFYSEKTIFARRRYAALQAGVEISRLVEIDRLKDGLPIEYVLEGGKQYRVEQVEPTRDAHGLKVYRLTLVKDGELYDIEQPGQ